MCVEGKDENMKKKKKKNQKKISFSFYTFFFPNNFSKKNLIFLPIEVGVIKERRKEK